MDLTSMLAFVYPHLKLVFMDPSPQNSGSKQHHGSIKFVIEPGSELVLVDPTQCQICTCRLRFYASPKNPRLTLDLSLRPLSEPGQPLWTQDFIQAVQHFQV